MKKTVAVITLAVTLAVLLVSVYTIWTYNEPYAYLMVYFEGNEDMLADGTRRTEEAFFYAISTNGYDYTALNDNKPILISNLGTGGVRDPFIFKSEEGDFIMLATDMHARYGWASNDSIVTFRSSDLINWTEGSRITLAREYPILEKATAAWAPQAIFDKEKGEYLVYFSSDKPSYFRGTRDEGMKCIYAFYTKDFKTLSEEPFLFFEIRGEDIIDADIVEDNGTYRMFYKTSNGQGIKMVSSKNLLGTYAGTTDVFDIMCEGSNAYKLINQDKWIVMADLFWGGWWGVNYTLAETTDFEEFTPLHMTGGYSLPFTPRHGYVITITRAEYYALKNHYKNTIERI